MANRYISVTVTWGFWKPFVRGCGIFVLSGILVVISCVPWLLGFAFGAVFWSIRLGFRNAGEAGRDILLLSDPKEDN